MSSADTPAGWVVLAVRFLLEVGALVALAAWGFGAAEGPARYLFAVGAPLAAAAVWGLFVAPKAPVPLSRGARLGVSLVVFGAGAVALFDADRKLLALAFAAVVVLDTVAVYALGLD